MKIYLLVQFFVLLSFFGKAQVISGRVLESRKNQPVGSVHIFAPKTGEGTISNENGEFELSGNFSEDDTLLMTHIAYTSLNVPISSITAGKDIVLYMDPQVIVLDEVIVTDIMPLVRKVMDWLKESPIKYGKAFYRQKTFRDTVATEWIEAFYDVAYTSNGIKKMRINQARFARKKYDTAYVFMSYKNFSYLTVGNIIYSPGLKTNEARLGRPFAEDFFSGYDFTLDRTYSNGTDTYHVVKYEPNHSLLNPVNTYGSFVYNITKNRLIQYMAIVEHALGADQIEGYEGNKDLELRNPKHMYRFNFSERTGDIEYITVEFTYDFIQNGEVFPSKVTSMFIIYQRLNDEPVKLRDPGLELEGVSNFENARYKPKLWRGNPIIRRTLEEDLIIASFEKENAFGTYFKKRK